jgi:hypothetical protein
VKFREFASEGFILSSGTQKQSCRAFNELSDEFSFNLISFDVYLWGRRNINEANFITSQKVRNHLGYLWLNEDLANDVITK